MENFLSNSYLKVFLVVFTLTFSLSGHTGETTWFEFGEEGAEKPMSRFDDLNRYQSMKLAIEEAKEMGQDVVKDFIVDRNDEGLRGPICEAGRSIANRNGKDVIQFWAGYDYSRHSNKLPEQMVDARINDMRSASFSNFSILSRSKTENHGVVYVTGPSSFVDIPREDYPLQEGYSKGEISKYSESNFFIKDRTYANGVLTMHFEEALHGEKICKTVNVWIDPQLTYATKMHFKKSVIIPANKECSKAAAAQETTCRLLIN